MVVNEILSGASYPVVGFNEARVTLEVGIVIELNCRGILFDTSISVASSYVLTTTEYVYVRPDAGFVMSLILT